MPHRDTKPLKIFFILVLCFFATQCGLKMNPKPQKTEKGPHAMLEDPNTEKKK